LTYHKNFDGWSKQKKQINAKKKLNFYINQREIWFTKTGVNIGFEEDGKKDFLRPVLVIKKIGNLFFVTSLTSKGKDNHIFYHKFTEASFDQDNQKHVQSSYAILSQAKVMDKRRFSHHIGIISSREFKIIKQKLRTLLL